MEECPYLLALVLEISFTHPPSWRPPSGFLLLTDQLSVFTLTPVYLEFTVFSHYAAATARHLDNSNNKA